MQTIASLGSDGQGLFLVCQNINVEITNIKPEPIKTYNLYLDKIVIHGNEEIIPASTAPMPKETNKAGSAQHKRVPRLANKVKRDPKISLKILFNTINLRDIVT